MNVRSLMIMVVTMLLVCSAGCRSIDYIGPYGENIKYSAIGPQKLDNVTMILPNGTKMSFDKQEADVEAVIDAIIVFLQQLRP